MLLVIIDIINEYVKISYFKYIVTSIQTLSLSLSIYIYIYYTQNYCCIEINYLSDKRYVSKPY